MKAKLIKHEGDYYCLLNDEGDVIADVNGGDIYRLSLKNCLVIERGYDLDELAEEYSTMSIFIDSRATEPPTIKEIEDAEYISEIAFKKGFQKALEILGDKKFSEQQMFKMFIYGDSIATAKKHVKSLKDKRLDEFFNDFIQSLQQNEWEVEVEMEWKPFANQCDQCGEGGKYMETPCDHPNDCLHWSPKIDSNGCMILKRI